MEKIKSYSTILGALIITICLVFHFNQKRADSDNKHKMPEFLPTLTSTTASSRPFAANHQSKNDAAENLPSGEVTIPAKTLPRLDWERYPGTLAEQIQRSLDQADGAMAADLAQKLLECKAVQLSLSPENYQQFYAGARTTPDDINKAVTQKYQRINSYCQTVSGDATQLRLRLLDVAIKDKITGAAQQSFRLGVRRPEVLQSILHDARAGDLRSINLVATEEPENLGIDGTKQAIFRYAMTLAAQESEPRSSARFALRSAESTVAFLRGEKTHQFDSHGLDESARNEAQAIAAQISIRQREFE